MEEEAKNNKFSTSKTRKAVKVVIVAFYLLLLILSAIFTMLKNSPLGYAYGAILAFIAASNTFYLIAYCVHLYRDTPLSNKMLGIGRLFFSVSIGLALSGFLYIGRYLNEPMDALVRNPDESMLRNSFFYVTSLLVSVIYLVTCFVRPSTWWELEEKSRLRTTRFVFVSILLVLTFSCYLMLDCMNYNFSKPLSYVFALVFLMFLGIFPAYIFQEKFKWLKNAWLLVPLAQIGLAIIGFLL